MDRRWRSRASAPHTGRWSLLLAALLPLVACRGPAPTADRLIEDLPLLEFPADSGQTLAVFLSGDGGWAELPREVARGLVGAGVAVVGFDSRRYLEEPRDAGRVAADVARAAEAYATAWNRDRVLLVGFSRGANLAAFAASDVPPGLRPRLAGVVLLAPGTHEKFRFRLLDLARQSADTAGAPVAPHIREIPGTVGVPVACVSGLREAAPVCAGLEGVPGIGVRLPDAGHHLGRDYPALVSDVLTVAAGDSAGQKAPGAATDQGGDGPDDAGEGQASR